MSEWHSSMARVYRADAGLMLERSRLHSAGALLYESAKQCINAVANQQGQNPGYTRAKTMYVRSIAGQHSNARFDLADGWQSASRLHIHADRGHLNEEDFHRNWLIAQAFIDDMLNIFAINTIFEDTPDSTQQEPPT